VPASRRRRPFELRRWPGGDLPARLRDRYVPDLLHPRDRRSSAG